ncbi:hypothetical protein LTR53_000459 [Teratosphaeriaceae sp. CCFEE 6253]|nr:hypothetical protein LTR53_000459 [Teratosphaeriaceae sp. CCFEE 6253]
MPALARLQAFAKLAHPTHTARRIARLAPPAAASTRCTCSNITSTRSLATTASPDTASLSRHASAIAQRLPSPDAQQSLHRFREFELDGRVYIVTGGAQGLGLTLAEALVEAGANVYCLDIQKEPTAPFYETQGRIADRFGGSLNFRHADVSNAKQLDEVISSIAAQHSRLDGLVAAAGIQYVKPALEYEPERVQHVGLLPSLVRGSGSRN